MLYRHSTIIFGDMVLGDISDFEADHGLYPKDIPNALDVKVRRLVQP